MTKKQKQTLVRIIVSLVLFVILLVSEHTGFFELLPSEWLGLIPYLAVYLLIGYDVILKAVKNISHGHIFDENFLMLIATIAAFFVGEYSEAAAVMLFYQTGELFQSYAVGKSRGSISELMAIAPEYANIETDDGLEQVDPDEVEVGSIIVIKPGEKVPLDGVVTEGETMLDTAALTGESVPRRASAGDEIISGCINGSGTLKVRVTKAYEESTVSRILELVENSASKKAHTEKFITKFAKVYTPFVTACAAVLAVIPPLFLGGSGELFAEWIKRACIFLVISCPCALVISVPLGFFGGIGAASRYGVLIKGGNYLEALSKLSVTVFDKTGTLTKGEFKVSDVMTYGVGKEELLTLAAKAEGYSDHPIAVSVRAAYEEESGKKTELSEVSDYTEEAGLGISARIGGRLYYAGNARLLEAHGIKAEEYGGIGTAVYIADEKKQLGTIIISDGIKDGAKQAIAEMKKAGSGKCVMLTGDRESTAKAVAAELGLDEYHSELMPSGKVEIVEKLLSECEGGTLAFVGDGINDAPVLSRADIGIAMGSMGSDAAIEAADIVIMDDDIKKIPYAIKTAKKTMTIVKQNIVFALSVKAVVMLLGAVGLANMWMAVFADVGVSVIAILNSMRTLKTKNGSRIS